MPGGTGGASPPASSPARSQQGGFGGYASRTGDASTSGKTFENGVPRVNGTPSRSPAGRPPRTPPSKAAQSPPPPWVGYVGGSLSAPSTPHTPAPNAGGSPGNGTAVGNGVVAGNGSGVGPGIGSGGTRALGRAVQVRPWSTTACWLRADPGLGACWPHFVPALDTQKCVEALSNLAFNCNLRRYTSALVPAARRPRC
jgi:hypothetical protein